MKSIPLGSLFSFYFSPVFSHLPFLNFLPVTENDIEEIIKEELETCEGTEGIYSTQKVEDILHCLIDFAIILQSTL